MPTILCLEKIVASGQSSFPIFIGFLAAKEILEVAEAPSFTKATTNQQIASNILTPPIKDWQRPLNDDRVVEISYLFNNSGEFMPNPVLLCENVISGSPQINISRQNAAGNIPTMVWEVNINAPIAGQEKPLWILDGQHRINGLAKSAQGDNPLPVVLLLNRGGNYYSGPLLAKIFAQVTTSATKLDELHNEWLTYAFKLGNYSLSVSNSSAHNDSMECIANLCKMPILSNTGPNNPFLDRIQFNHYRSNQAPPPGGFSYTCIELKELIYRYYYNSAATSAHLAPDDLANELCKSHLALSGLVTAPQDKTAFFGTNEFGQKIMQDAFFAGIMSHLLRYGRPANWTSVLRGLAFDKTDWNFKSWVVSLSGPAQSISKSIAMDVFVSAFRNNALPQNTTNLADYLKGDSAAVKFEACDLTPTGRVSKTGRSIFEVMVGARRSWDVTPKIHVKISEKSQNIGKLEITDKQSPPGRTVPYTKDLTGSGLRFEDKNHNNPIQLLIMMHHYGGNTSEASLDIKWK